MNFYEWKEEYFSDLFNLYRIVTKYNSIDMKNDKLFNKMCIFIYNNDLKYKPLNLK